MKVINNFANDGYKVKIVYAKAPTNTARMKNIKRGLVTGRLIPDEYFNQMSQLNKSFGFTELSMGMSADYLKAIKNLSSYVRIGSSIFGERS